MKSLQILHLISEDLLDQNARSIKQIWSIWIDHMLLSEIIDTFLHLLSYLFFLLYISLCKDCAHT